MTIRCTAQGPWAPWTMTSSLITSSPPMETDTVEKTDGFTLADDLSVHPSIARTTRNFLRVDILKHIFDLSGDFLDNVLENLVQNSDNLPLLCEHHRKVFEAIKNKDAKRSRMEMETHLEWVQQEWMRIIDGIAQGPPPVLETGTKCSHT